MFLTFIASTKKIKWIHFDVLLPKGSGKDKALGFAKEWLQGIGIEAKEIHVGICRFCHSEIAKFDTMQLVTNNGYAILQMEGCPSPIF